MTPSRIDLVVLERDVLRELAAGDLASAGERAGLSFPEFFIGEAWLWRLHDERMRLYPESVGWLSQLVLERQNGAALG
jgi:hypothetical protein